MQVPGQQNIKELGIHFTIHQIPICKKKDVKLIKII
jgi:hypothetical protein